MGFFSFLALLAIAYLLWRIGDLLPDLVYRISEIQRDVGEIRLHLRDGMADAPSSSPDIVNEEGGGSSNAIVSTTTPEDAPSSPSSSSEPAASAKDTDSDASHQP